MDASDLDRRLTEEHVVAMGLSALNRYTREEACTHFRRCCGSSKWVHGMEQARPFSDIAELQACADRIWKSCSPEDWREAFAAHPKIGGDSKNRWAQEEQSGVAGTAGPILQALAQANRAYEARFGYTFIVCATGKSAAEMLAILEQRLNNDAETELKNAAEQECLILGLRLRKLLIEWA